MCEGQGGNEDGTPQIVVTSEMIEAGSGCLAHYLSYEDCDTDFRDIAYEVFSAMAIASLQPGTARISQRNSCNERAMSLASLLTSS